MSFVIGIGHISDGARIGFAKCEKGDPMCSTVPEPPPPKKPHKYLYGSPGFGDTTDNGLLFAAQAVTDPCTDDIAGGGNQSVMSFEEAWNDTTDPNLGSPKLVVAGKYGPKDAGALTAVLGTDAPDSCPKWRCGAGQVWTAAGCANVVVVTDPGGSTSSTSSTSSSKPKSEPVWPWIVGGVALAGAVGYGLHRYKKHRGKR